jgi:hypothetical protein
VRAIRRAAYEPGMRSTGGNGLETETRAQGRYQNQKLLIIHALDSEFESIMARWRPSGEGKPQVCVDWGRCQMGRASPLSETCNKLTASGATDETNML